MAKLCELIDAIARPPIFTPPEIMLVFPFRLLLLFYSCSLPVLLSFVSVTWTPPPRVPVMARFAARDLEWLI